MAFESYITINNKRYRRGFTSGSAAAAAAKGATLIFFRDKVIKKVAIDTPAGISLTIPLKRVEKTSDFVRVVVEKDAGDDPDVTDGLEICAQVKEINQGIVLEGGLGVGRVTKPGLAVAIGEAAINPIPREMILQEVASVLPENKGVKIIIEVPRGAEVAQKTFNPNLGIVGGISILGTTGIVEPMSEKAYQESLALELKQAVALGKQRIVLVFGNYGQEMAKKLGFPADEIIRMSNFVGYMLKQCSELEISELVILGHLGKLGKVAGGIFQTHSSVADARREVIAAYTATLGGDQEIVKQILASNTSEEAVELILRAGLDEVFNLLAERVVCRVKEYLKTDLLVKSIIFSMEKGVLGSYGLKSEELTGGDGGEADICSGNWPGDKGLSITDYQAGNR